MIIVAPDASELEKFAAEELCRYLEELFDISVRPAARPTGAAEAVFLVGLPKEQKFIQVAAPGLASKDLSDQGVLLGKAVYRNCPAFVVGGGSARAVLWAVYELVEYWGVRFLADRDVFPEKTAPFMLPDLEKVQEPVFRVRAHPTIQDFAASGESWGMEHFRVLIDQLAKLKFNRLCIFAYGWQPFLHWEYKGVKRQTATLWYDYHYHITPDMVGREIFGDENEFWNPDLPYATNYQKMVAAGVKLMRELIAYGHKRGMECVVGAPMTDFPPEFSGLLPGSERSHQLGGASIVPGQSTRMDDRNLEGMASAVLDATLKTYPDADMAAVWMPEFRQWTGEFQRAWDVLDAKYRISEVLKLSDVLAAAEARGKREGDPNRVVTEVKADITSLYFYDKMLRSKYTPEIVKRQKTRFLYWGVVEELFPILDRILPEEWNLEIMPTNHPATLLKRVGVLQTLPESISSTMALTIDDDNIGVLPQLTTKALHRTIKVMKRRGWTGFTARERYPTDHDVVLAYLGRVAWDNDATPDSVARDIVGKICGEAAVEGFLKAFDAIEKTTEGLSVTNFAFPADWPIPTKSNPGGMLLKHMIAGKQPPYMAKARSGYQRALEHARRARKKCLPAGMWYADFWCERLKFAVCYIECAQKVQEIANAQEAKDHVLFTKLADEAVEKLREGLEAYAGVVRSQTDRGAIAVVNEYGFRQLRARSWAYHAHGANYLKQYL